MTMKNFIFVLFCVLITNHLLAETKELSDVKKEASREKRQTETEEVSDVKKEASREKRQSDFSPNSYFEQFGYLEPLGDTPGSHSDAAVQTATRLFQRMAGLPQTGELDRRTIRKMRSPRCGVKDFTPPRNQPSNLQLPEPYRTIGAKWPGSTVTWKIAGYTYDLPRESQRRAYYNAFAKWANVANLNFREVSGNQDADILISYGRYHHGDGAPFDGRGRTLAHAYFPGNSPISGDTHFDDDEDFTENTPEGTNLEIVAAHEFGHALGLSHSQVSEALMAPFYQGYDPNYSLHQDDINGIRSLYGGRQATRRPPTTRRPSRPRTTRGPRTTRQPSRPTRRPSRPTNVCNLRFDATFTGHDGYLYAMRGRKIYRFNRNGVGIQRGFPKNVRQVYNRAPKNIGAAVYHGRNLYMFKGNKYWKYTGYRLESGYPKRFPGSNNFFSGIQAAGVYANRIYLFKGSQFSVWDERYTSVPRGYPLDSARYFPRVPRNPESAVVWNGILYFFKGANYVKFDARSRRVPSGYPKPKAGPWLGCGRVTPK